MYTFQTRIHLISHRIFRARNVSVFNGNLFTFTIFLLQNIYYSNFCFMEKFVQENVCEVTYLTLVASQFCFYQRIQSQLYLLKGCHLSLHGNKTLWLYIFMLHYNPPFKVFKYRNFYKCSSLACSRRWDSGVRCEGSFSAHMYLFVLFPRSERLDLKYHSNGREWITEKIQALFFLSFFLSVKRRPRRSACSLQT